MVSKTFNFIFNDTFTYTGGDLVETISNNRTFHHYGLSENELEKIASTKDWTKIGELLTMVESDHFVLFVYDGAAKQFCCYNDRSGHNEIYLQKTTTNEWQISSDIKPQSTLSDTAVNEYLLFHTVLPPKTMYEGVETVPMASYSLLEVGAANASYTRYWHPETFFNPKATDYDTLTKELREACVQDVVEKQTPQTGIALSGGIDSGAILGMMHSATDKTIETISFGPHGEGSNDLISARKTAEHFSARNTEIYPSHNSFEYLFTVLPKLSHPVPPDILIPLCHIFETAKDKNLKLLQFGYGVQAVLGNLHFNRLWHKVGLLERFTPYVLRKAVFSVAAKIMKLSENQTAILLSNDWVVRFLYNQAALYTREKQLYRKVDNVFMETMADSLRPYMRDTTLLLSDRFVLLYLFGWTHLSQERDTPMIAKQFSVGYNCPINAKNVLETIFTTPDTFRKKNKWNKQLWRDAFKPFVPEHLYNRKGKSLVIPYTKVFADELDRFLPYLESHPVINEYIDLDEYKKSFKNLPEPGLSLLRFVSFGIWYDARHNPKNLEQVRQLFTDFAIKNKTNA